SDQAAGHKLADEDDAPIRAGADIVAKVQLGKVIISRTAHAQNAGTGEFKSYQADKRVAVETIQLQALWEPALQKFGVDVVGCHQQILPASGEKGFHEEGFQFSVFSFQAIVGVS